ncbi:MAG: SIS domain-containing protein [Candidatus Helarchaeota archaeon]
MIYTKVPIKEAALNDAFESFNDTWKYLLTQTQTNIEYIFTVQQSTILELMKFLIEDCHPQFQTGSEQRKLDFAAAGRSLYMGAKTFAHRLSQLGFYVDYPHPEKEISGPPSSLVTKNDVIIAISSSGKTESAVNKSKFAKKLGCKIIAGLSTLESPLGLIPPDTILEIPSNVNEKSMNAPYPKAFTPLGTLFEFTNAVFWECFSRGLYECLENAISYEKAFAIMNSSCKNLINTAFNDLNICLNHSENEIRNLITNLILKYFSEHTVHLYGRGKIFNLQIAPFEMRLRQMPHGYITSILNYAPKNRPVKRGQLAILSSGSGGLSLTAEVLRDCEAMVVGLTAHKTDSTFWNLLDIPIYLPGRQQQSPHDWERQQWEGVHADYAPTGIQFEINGCAFFESIFAAVCRYLGLTENDLRGGHANKKLE